MPGSVFKAISSSVREIHYAGPHREFFQLAIKEVFMMSGLFHGWPQNVVLCHNVEALADSKYFLVGRLIAMCLVQGGQPPVCFSAGVADYFVYDDITSQPCLDDIHDVEIRDKLKKVQCVCVCVCARA